MVKPDHTVVLEKYPNHACTTYHGGSAAPEDCNSLTEWVWLGGLEPNDSSMQEGGLEVRVDILDNASFWSAQV